MPIGITRWIAPVGPASKAIKADFSFYFASMLSVRHLLTWLKRRCAKDLRPAMLIG